MVESCYPLLDRLFFLVGKRPWNGSGGSNVRTLDSIRKCDDPDSKITVVEGDWPNEPTQRNAGLNLCAEAGLTFCFIVDADEVYDPDALAFMMGVVMLQRTIQAWYVSQITYWKSYLYRIDGIARNDQLGFVRVGEVSFIGIRRTDARHVVHFPSAYGVCHHLSYALTNEQVLKKIEWSSHAKNIRKSWYSEVWLRWDTNHVLENLHPMEPRWYPRAVLQSPRAYPPVLRRRYERDMAAGIKTASSGV
jgi:glycosyltransferase involved in cell wall biosynthesis